MEEAQKTIQSHAAGKVAEEILSLQNKKKEQRKKRKQKRKKLKNITQEEEEEQPSSKKTRRSPSPLPELPQEIVDEYRETQKKKKKKEKTATDLNSQEMLYREAMKSIEPYMTKKPFYYDPRDVEDPPALLAARIKHEHHVDNLFHHMVVQAQHYKQSDMLLVFPNVSFFLVSYLSLS